VVECHCVNFVHDFSAFVPGMRKDKFEANGFAKAFANDIEKKLDPTHKPRKESFALGMDLVYEIIEGLFMPLH
jgi:hypothetical protein